MGMNFWGNMIEIQKNFMDKTWKWQHNNSICAEVTEKRSDNPTMKIKQNPLRTIYRIDTDHRGSFFVKHDHPRGFFKKIRTVFKNKIQSEFESAMLLRECNIPIVKYLDWGRCGPDSILVSITADCMVSGKEFWHTRAMDSIETRNTFLENLTSFVKSFVNAGISHPDFHSSNILVSPDINIVLVDPYGVKQRTTLTEQDKIELSKIFVDFRGEISRSEAIQLLQDSEISRNKKEATKLWQLTLKDEYDKIVKNWPKCCEQILSGQSKFCTQQISQGHECIFRHTTYYKPLFSNMSELPSNLRREQLSSEKAKKHWLESFKQQLLREDQTDIPVIWQKNGPKSILYYK